MEMMVDYYYYYYHVCYPLKHLNCGGLTTIRHTYRISSSTKMIAGKWKIFIWSWFYTKHYITQRSPFYNAKKSYKKLNNRMGSQTLSVCRRQSINLRKFDCNKEKTNLKTIYSIVLHFVIFPLFFFPHLCRAVLRIEFSTH